MAVLTRRRKAQAKRAKSGRSRYSQITTARKCVPNTKTAPVKNKSKGKRNKPKKRNKVKRKVDISLSPSKKISVETSPKRLTPKKKKSKSYNMWRSKSRYGPLYRRLQAFALENSDLEKERVGREKSAQKKMKEKEEKEKLLKKEAEEANKSKIITPKKRAKKSKSRKAAAKKSPIIFQSSDEKNVKIKGGGRKRRRRTVESSSEEDRSASESSSYEEIVIRRKKKKKISKSRKQKPETKSKKKKSRSRKKFLGKRGDRSFDSSESALEDITLNDSCLYVYKKGVLTPVVLHDVKTKTKRIKRSKPKKLKAKRTSFNSRVIIPTESESSSEFMYPLNSPTPSPSPEKNPKFKQSRIRKRKNRKCLKRQMIEQQKRMDTLDSSKERYCLLDYWEDFENTIDVRNALVRGRHVPRKRSKKDVKSINFSIQKSNNGQKYRIIVDEDLFASCSCLDWRTKCKSLGIFCKHIYYITKYILKYDHFGIEDNRLTNSLKFFACLSNIKIDYALGKPVGQIRQDKCMICYGDLRTKNGWTWVLDTSNIFKCPDCSKMVHNDCAKNWIRSSDFKNCVFCRSDCWKRYF